MISSKTINASRPMPMNTILAAGSSLTLGLSCSGTNNSNDIIVNGTLFVKASSSSGLFLYYRDSFNNLFFLDKASSTSGGALFDISRYLFLYKYDLSRLVLFNESDGINNITIYGTGHKLNVDYHGDATFYKTECVISNSINDTASYRYDYITREFALKKDIYIGLLKIDLSIVFSNKMVSASNGLFPPGWKISFLNYLTVDQSNNPTKFVDKNNASHTLTKTADSDDYFYTTDGSRLIFRKYTNDGNIYFEQVSDLTNEKWIFGPDGNLVSYTNGNNDVFTVSRELLTITISDQYNNSITIFSNIFLGTLVIKLNNSLEYDFELESSTNRLLSISHGDYTDSIEYWSNGCIYSYSTHDNYLLENSFDNNDIVTIKYKHNSYVVEKLDFEYSYLKTIITNKHNVKMYCCIDTNLNKMSEGELLDNTLESCLLFESDNMLVKDLKLSFVNPTSRIYKKTNTESTVFNYTSNGTTNYHSKYIGNLELIKANRTYIFSASLKKTNDYPLNSNRYVEVYLYCGTTLVKTITFNNNLKTQTVAVDFVANADETNDAKYQIKISLAGMSELSSVSVFNVSITEFKGKQDNYFTTVFNDTSFTGLSTTAFSFDNIDWYQFTSAQDSNDNSYSFVDLLLNYVSVHLGKHLFWSNDGSLLTYNTNNPDTSNGGYVLRQHRNIQTANAMFAKKSFIKEYLDNDVIKEIFEFAYLIKTTNGFDLIKIKSVGGETLKSYKSFNDIFALTKEAFDDGTFDEYLYVTKTGNIKTKLISNKKTKANNLTEYIETTYQYDLNYRASSVFELVDDDIEAVGSTYFSNYEVASSIIDQAQNAESYQYDSYFDYLSSISKSSVAITRSVSDPSLSIVSNDSYFKTELTSSSEQKTFSIKYRDGYSNNYGNVVTYQKTSDSDNDYLTTTIYGSNRFRNVYDKYGRISSIQKETQNGYEMNAIYCYFDSKPSNLGDLNTIFDIESYISQNNPSITSVAKLYKIISDKRYEFDYTDSGKPKTCSVKNSDSSTYFSINYSYDKFDRLKSSSYFINLGYYLRRLFYEDDFHETIKEIKYIYSSMDQTIKRDKLQRISRIALSAESNLSNYYINVFNYKTFGNVTNQLVKRIDEYSGTASLNTTYISSVHYDYDEKGNIVSYKNGTTSTPNNSTGVRYTYDSNNQLTKEKNYELNQTKIYNYDYNGNITSVVTKSLDELTTISTETYSYHQYYKDLLVSFNGTSITYDDYFNPVAIGTNVSLSWTMNRQLASYIKSNVTTSFTYNHNGIRTKKVNPNTGTHEYYLEGNNIVGEKITLNNSTSYMVYFYGINGVTGFLKDGNYYYFKKNIFGDVISIYSGSYLVAYYKYDAYGNHKVFDSNGVEINSNYQNYQSHIGYINPFRYRGYYYDVETGCYYCQARYYLPEIRRWISMDDFQYFDSETLLGTNLFAYCLNNPVMNVDPEGNIIISLLIAGFFLGAIIAGSASIVIQSLQNGVENINWWQVLLDTSIGGLSGLVAFSGIGMVGSGLVGAAIGFTSSALGDYVSTGSVDGINWGKAAFMALVNFGIGLASGPGVQNSASVFSKLSGSSVAFKAICTSISKGHLSQSILNLYGKKLAKDLANVFFDSSLNAIVDTGISELINFILGNLYDKSST